MGVNVGVLTNAAVGVATTQNAIDTVQKGIDQHLNPATGDTRAAIDELSKTEAQSPALRDKLLQDNSAVQALVDAQVTLDTKASALASGSELQTAIDGQESGAPLTDDMSKRIEDIQKKEAADPTITAEMWNKHPEVQKAVEKSNNSLEAIKSGDKLNLAIGRNGGLNGAPMTDEMSMLANDITKRESEDPEIAAKMREKHPNVQTFVDRQNNAPVAWHVGDQLQAEADGQAAGAPLTDKMKDYAKDIRTREAEDPSIRGVMLNNAPKAQAIVDKMVNRDSAFAAADEWEKSIPYYPNQGNLSPSQQQLAENIQAWEDADPALKDEFKTRYPSLQAHVDKLPPRD